jgi:hypothetical protein
MKQPDPNRQNAIEALLPELQRLEIPNLKRRQPGGDKGRVSTPRRLDHRGGAIDGEEMPGLQLLADIRRGNAMPTADLQDPMMGLHHEIPYNGSKAIAGHGAVPTLI